MQKEFIQSAIHVKRLCGARYILYLSLSTIKVRRVQNNFQYNRIKVLFLYWQSTESNSHYFKLCVLPTIEDRQRTRSPTERARYLAHAIVLSPSRSTAEIGSSARRFHFVQWFVITAANMVYAGSSSHPKQQANYNVRQRPRKSSNGASPCGQAHHDPMGFTILQRRHRLIIRVLHSRSYSPTVFIFRSSGFSIRHPATAPTDRYCPRWFKHRCEEIDGLRRPPLLRIPRALGPRVSSTWITSYGSDLVFVNRRGRNRLSCRITTSRCGIY